MAGGRFHDDEARPPQMLHEPLGDDARHDLAEVAGVLSAAVAQRQDELAEAGHFTQEAGVIIVEKAMASFSS